MNPTFNGKLWFLSRKDRTRQMIGNNICENHAGNLLTKKYITSTAKKIQRNQIGAFQFVFPLRIKNWVITSEKVEPCIIETMEEKKSQAKKGVDIIVSDSYLLEGNTKEKISLIKNN